MAVRDGARNRKPRAETRIYTDEFRLRAIQLASPPPTGIGIRPAARQLGVHAATLQRWVKLAKNVAERLSEDLSPSSAIAVEVAEKPKLTPAQEADQLVGEIELNILRELKRRTGTKSIASEIALRDLVDLGKTFVKPKAGDAPVNPGADRTPGEKITLIVNLLQTEKKRILQLADGGGDSEGTGGADTGPAGDVIIDAQFVGDGPATERLDRRESATGPEPEVVSDTSLADA